LELELPCIVLNAVFTGVKEPLLAPEFPVEIYDRVGTVF